MEHIPLPMYINSFFNKKMYLCDEFFNLNDDGALNKSGIVVHEGTHKGIKTKDYAYPFQTSVFQNLSNKQKVNNAASWERFYNKVYKNGF